MLALVGSVWSLGAHSAAKKEVVLNIIETAMCTEAISRITS